MSTISYSAVSPDTWPRARGYSHATLATGSRILRISGQLGKKPQEQQVSETATFADQWRLALENVIAVVQAVGGEAQNIVMLRAYLTDIGEFRSSQAAIGEGWAATLGRHFPAMTLLEVSALIDPRAKVEIEAEAVLA
jgi:enamine deaminase RidA (YjgF/YER057c/UK114 family)